MPGGGFIDRTNVVRTSGDAYVLVSTVFYAYWPMAGLLPGSFLDVAVTLGAARIIDP